MTARDGRGGPRQPARPAAVSNPGSGRRTDGGPGSATQPLRVASGGAYGQRKAATELQQGAPLPAPPAPGAGGGAPGGGQPGMPPGMAEGVFGSSGRGGAGPGGGVFGPSTGPSIGRAPVGPVASIAQDPQLFLRILASKYPLAAISRLVDSSAERSGPQQ